MFISDISRIQPIKSTWLIHHSYLPKATNVDGSKKSSQLLILPQSWDLKCRLRPFHCLYLTCFIPLWLTSCFIKKYCKNNLTALQYHMILNWLYWSLDSLNSHAWSVLPDLEKQNSINAFNHGHYSTELFIRYYYVVLIAISLS